LKNNKKNKTKDLLALIHRGIDKCKFFKDQMLEFWIQVIYNRNEENRRKVLDYPLLWIS